MRSKSSVNILDEKNKSRDQGLGKAYFRSPKKYGFIKELHPTQYAVKVSLAEGGVVPVDGYFPVVNAWQQLIHDFGNLRPGLVVEVVYIGDQETTAEVRVIALEGESIGQLQEPPTIDLALYEIFSPGM